jgi:hypothetical protein
MFVAHPPNQGPAIPLELAGERVKPENERFLQKLTCGLWTALSRWRKLHIIFGCDVRALAAYRVGVAIILLLNLYVTWVDLFPWFADLGVWPIRNAMKFNPSWWSIHFINGNVEWQGLLHIISFVVHTMFLVGYKTPLSGVLTWVLHTSLQNRNFLILNGGDVYLRMSLFWTMFLPLGEVYSVDSMLKKMKKGSKQSSSVDPYDTKPEGQSNSKLFVSVATIAFLFQIWVVYVFTWAIKTGKPWHDGTAIYLALSLDSFTTRIGYLLYRFPTLMKIITHVVIRWEIFAPMILLSPIWTQQLRIVSVIGMWLMHIGFGMCMEIGLFPWLPIPITMLFLPPLFWDRVLGWLAARRKKQRAGVTVYVNQNCGDMLLKVVEFLKTFFFCNDCNVVVCTKNSEATDSFSLPLSTLPSELLERKMCLAVVDDASGSTNYDAKAVFVLLRSAILLWPLAWLGRFSTAVSFVGYLLRMVKPMQGEDEPELEDPAQINQGEANGDTLYKWSPPSHLAKHKRSKARKKMLIGIRELFLVVCLIIVVDWNYSSFYRTPIHIPQSAHMIVNIFRLDQWWGMFSPQPPTDDGWFVIPGKLANGEEVDLYKDGAPVSWDKPYLVSHTYPSEKWRKYMMNLYSEQMEDMKLGYGRYLCRGWNWYGGHGEDRKLLNFQIIYVREFTLPDYKTTPHEKIVVWEHQC